jgi:hypothetical protein
MTLRVTLRGCVSQRVGGFVGVRAECRPSGSVCFLLARVCVTLPPPPAVDAPQTFDYHFFKGETEQSVFESIAATLGTQALDAYIDKYSLSAKRRKRMTMCVGATPPHAVVPALLLAYVADVADVVVVADVADVVVVAGPASAADALSRSTAWGVSCGQGLRPRAPTHLSA